MGIHETEKDRQRQEITVTTNDNYRKALSILLLLSLLDNFFNIRFL